ncbi:DNA repair protein [Sesamum alatum]|uniref:DNA repair protein n=1 Tax=Sesamum alatum TaxID=300844 RepID=A0AAE1XS53_9LAMI|nr:DNA repair protein [Sesamum alatum]
MRTRSQSKRPQSVGEQEEMKSRHVPESIDDIETLSNISRDAVGKLLQRVNKGFNKDDVAYLRHCESAATMERGSRDSDKRSTGTAVEKGTADPEYSGREAMQFASNPEMDEDDKDYDDSEWEDGSIPTLSSMKDFQEDLVSGVSVEFDVSHCLPKRKPVRRATAEEKEVAEFVHKAHLLCLLGRGRLIDSACNDPLIQASLLSLVPTHLLKIAESSKLTASHLVPLVSWFHNNFHVRSQSVAEKLCHSALVSTLETREGTPEAVAALSVALFRALNLTTRFLSILDVVSLKPDGDISEPVKEIVSKRQRDIFSSSTLMVAGPSCSSASTVKSSPEVEQGISQTAAGGAGSIRLIKSKKKNGLQCQDSLTIDKPNVVVPEAPTDISEPCLVKSDGLKRKGDLEFQLQLEMALSATAIGSSKISMASSVSESPSTSSTLTPPSKRMRKIKKEESHTSSDGISTAIGSKKVGAPLFWAEVFCSGENLTGKWVHVDAINGIVDGEHKVEAAAAACKKSLRYVVAFAGQGAKDVTRRYCTKWYKVAAKRINSSWWDAVLAPLKELESGATGGVVNLDHEASPHEKNEESQVANLNHSCSLDKNHSCRASKECSEKQVEGSSMRKSFVSTRSSLEDMELETRALTEPLPTNQQAYRNHHLYVIERWLNKNQVLYPKGPVLGFCSGHAVYPRTCVQTLRTKEKWLREGLQVKDGEVPAKVLKRSQKRGKEEAVDDNNCTDGDPQEISAFYGRWQTEPLHLPRAVNGIVPKNERGRVDVWSEKCLPPGTVHLRLPRVAAVAKRLGIDYASAMVGFEFRNGRSAPLFEGIVVCSEFKDAILQAYLEEEERREADEKRRNEAQALSRWYQLLSSIITRQRLNNCYGAGALSQSSTEIPKSDDKCPATATRAQELVASPRCQLDNSLKK